MPCYSFLYQLYNLNYDNIPLKLIFRNKTDFWCKKSISWFLAKLSIFHLKKSLEKSNSDFSEKLFEELQELKSILTIYFNEKVDNFTKNQENDFLHQISVFSPKICSEEYYHNSSCINSIKMCNMAFGPKFSLVFGK